ncbi:MAG: protein phosphatase 2C domain-containing protein [Acidaminococcales bacterium]|jgi:hypothetical protein|nr:protein phosphatase 2C domain-containing protein [Acidaminococcales bacterium]
MPNRKPAFTFAASAQGERHKKHGQPCEDFALHYRDERHSFAVVSDGHGNDMCFRSGRGARFACEAAAECFNNFTDQILVGYFRRGKFGPRDFCPAFDRILPGLCASIHEAWKRRVLYDWRHDAPDFGTLNLDPAGYDENIFVAYGCTLIAVAATNSFWFGVQIGDGKCVTLEDGGGFSEPIPWDETCQFNITTSLCEENAPELFRHFAGAELPEALFIGTDGVDTSFLLEKNDEKIAGMYRIILDNFKDEGFEKGRRQLEDFLPVLTGRGSGDDVSIAGILFQQER